MKRTVPIALFAIAALSLVPLSSAGGNAQYRVDITNLTGGEVFTPIVVAAHQPDVQPFTPGQPALVELEMLAEGGTTGPLVALLGSLPQVGDVDVSDGVLPPGQTTTVWVRARSQADHISVLAMLVPTNDAFVALNTVPGPTGNKSAMFTAVAWDAGTEANDESCDAIPGPPHICEGEGFNEDRDDPAAFVRIHSGIHGIGDLSAADHDWRNPVARVVITRVPGGGDDDDSDSESDSDADSDDDSDSDEDDHNYRPKRKRY